MAHLLVPSDMAGLPLDPTLPLCPSLCLGAYSNRSCIPSGKSIWWGDCSSLPRRSWKKQFKKELSSSSVKSLS